MATSRHMPLGSPGGQNKPLLGTTKFFGDVQFFSCTFLSLWLSVPTGRLSAWKLERGKAWGLERELGIDVVSFFVDTRRQFEYVESTLHLIDLSWIYPLLGGV